MRIHVEIEFPHASGLNLEVTSLSGVEHIGRPYEFTVRFAQPSSQTPLDPAATIAASVILRFGNEVEGALTVMRTVRGVVKTFQDDLEHTDGSLFWYTAVVQPHFAELARFIAQDAFVGRRIPDIIKDKLEAARFSDQDFALRILDMNVYGASEWTDGAATEVIQPRLTVQYRESDFAFLSRLAEHVGISFFFEDQDDKEVLVFTDHTNGFAQRTDPVGYKGAGTGCSSGAGSHGILALSRRTESIASDFYVYDYNYRTPGVTYSNQGAQVFDVLGGEAHLDVPSGGAHFDYAANAKTPQEAALLALVRADAEEATRERFVGHGDLPYFYAGLRFKMSDHQQIASTEELLTVSVTHTYEAQPSFLAGDGRKPPKYSVSFELVRAAKTGPQSRTIAYRPPQRTPKPRIHGVVTGVVQDITQGVASPMQHIDAYGRYLIKLHYDQSHKVTPRVRMAQPHTGTNYGQHFPLRPGAEVVVAFLDGDPDRPIIVGSAPNPLKGSPVVEAKGNEPVEMHRIQSRSGIVFEISDGSATTP